MNFKRILIGASFASFLTVGLAAIAAINIPGQVNESDALPPPTSLLLLKVRVEARIKERLERSLGEKDFEASRYDQSYKIEYVREVERGPMGERQFIIAVPLETGFMVNSWVTDRMNVSIRSTQRTWGLWTRVVERRIADQ